MIPCCMSQDNAHGSSNHFFNVYLNQDANILQAISFTYIILFMNKLTVNVEAIALPIASLMFTYISLFMLTFFNPFCS